MTYIQYQNTKHQLEEFHQQAYRDYLVSSLQPSLRERLAKLLTTLATKLQTHSNQPRFS